MITIYKTNYEFYGATYVQCFSLSGNIKEQMDNWEATRDQIVFDEQMARGSFYGSFPVDDAQRSMMDMLRKQGVIQPYYGAINAGVCTCSLQVTPPTCSIGIEHTATKESTTLEDAVTILKAKASVVAQQHQQGFMIKRQEYHTLRQWKFWNAKDEFTARYIYVFNPTTMGLGITILDTRTQEKINITD